MTYTMPITNPIQVTTADISVKIGSIGDVPAVGEFLELKFNSHLVGIIGLNNFELYTETDAFYTFYYFPRVTMLLAYKKLASLGTTVQLGAQ